MSFFLTAAWAGHTEMSREMAQDIARALELAGLKHSDAAARMGITLPMLSRQLAGVEPLNVYRLGFLPIEFHAAWLQLRAKRIGGELLPADQLALVRGAAVLGFKRMTRVLPSLTSERHSA